MLRFDEVEHKLLRRGALTSVLWSINIRAVDHQLAVDGI
jgi:hypothetical protein